MPFAVHFWLLLACMVVYSVLVGWLLHCFPLSFTLVEAMIVGQGVTLMVIDTGLQLLQMVRDVTEGLDTHLNCCDRALH